MGTDIHQEGPIWETRAMQLFQAGQLAQAEAAMRIAVAHSANPASALNNLASIFVQRGNRTAAIKACQVAISLNPTLSEAVYNLGVALSGLGHLGLALSAFRRVTYLVPGNASAFYAIGTLLEKQDRVAEAASAFRDAITLHPAMADPYSDLSVALMRTEDLREATMAAHHARALSPEDARICINSSVVFNRFGLFLGQSDLLVEAELACRKAIALNPQIAESHCHLGEILQTRELRVDAVAAFRAALHRRNDFPEAVSNLIHQSQHICDWRGLARLYRKAITLARSSTGRINPFSLLAMPSTLADQLACARHWGKTFEVRDKAKFHHYPKVTHRKIRIGYLSSDFCNHATAFLAVGLFECHDRSRFEIFGYSYSPDDKSAMRSRLIAAFDHFVEVGLLSPAAAARRIHDDGIDILVDMKGYTFQARTRILAYRPAPIQVSYLGYPGTMGQDFIDYIIVDQVIAPSEEQKYYSECLVHLPHCYQPNDIRRMIADRQPSRQECNLPEHGFVFCSFNSSYKITPVFFAIWLRLLKAVPGSVLWLLETNSTAHANLRREAVRHGVTPDRLRFAPRVALPDHLARHCHADLFLDTLPVNAHTTASDALWAGVPVLTCTGDTFAGRVASSLLKAIGLPELATMTLADYEAQALALATRPALLAGIRQKLQENRATAPLFDVRRLTTNIEQAYSRIWENWCAGQPAKPISIKESPLYALGKDG